MIKAGTIREGCFDKVLSKKTCIIEKLHSCAPWAHLHLERVLDKPFSFLLKPRDTDGVSHVRLTNVKFVALTFFVTKKLATLA